MRVAYIYTMKNQPDRVGVIAPDHAAYWRGLNLPGYLGGPFADRSGGLITFEVTSEEEADRLIAADPFVQEDLLDRSRTAQWLVE